MKDYALELADKAQGNTAKLNVLREYLQALVIRILQERNAFRNLAFIGGTALRMLHGLPRFSEDLDFSLTKKDNHNFEELLKYIKSELVASGYSLSVSFKAEKTVQSAFIKFSSLLYETGITPIKSQNLSINLEIDTNPPDGAHTNITPLLVHFPLEILSYDPSSLFAGKCHALLSRTYTKGRDYFDLAWYLSKWKSLTPNPELLRNSLTQTNSRLAITDSNSWVRLLMENVEQANWKKVEDDVAVFLERENDLKVFSQANILSLLRSKLS